MFFNLKKICIFAAGTALLSMLPNFGHAAGNGSAGAASVKNAKGSVQPSAADKAKDDALLRNKALESFSRLQVLIEYYYMQSGRYPHTLKALENSFNLGLPDSAPKIDLGCDPISGLPFVYAPSSDYLSYSLAFPQPEKFGKYPPILKNIDWAWLKIAAEGKRMERHAVLCTENIEGLATRCELYAKDHEKAFPANLNALRPVYMPRELVCPSDGRPYVYVFKRGGYSIACPGPENHGLKTFMYDSEKGLILEELKPEAGNSPEVKKSEAKSETADKNSAAEDKKVYIPDAPE